MHQKLMNNIAKSKVFFFFLFMSLSCAISYVEQWNNFCTYVPVVYISVIWYVFMYTCIIIKLMVTS